MFTSYRHSYRPKKHQQFTREEERDLWVRMQAGDMLAKNLLACSIIPLAMMIGGRRNRGRIDPEELGGLVYLAIAKALNAFHPDRGRLSTMLKKLISNEIFAYLCTSMGPVQAPVHIQETSPRYRYVIRARLQGKSLSKPLVNEGDETTLGDLLVSRDDDPSDVAAHNDEIEYLRQRYKWAMRHIKRPRDRGVLIRRHRGETLAEIGARLCITRERVRQVAGRAEREFQGLLLQLPAEK